MSKIMLSIALLVFTCAVVDGVAPASVTLNMTAQGLGSSQTWQNDTCNKNPICSAGIPRKGIVTGGIGYAYITFPNRSVFIDANITGTSSGRLNYYLGPNQGAPNSTSPIRVFSNNSACMGTTVPGLCVWENVLGIKYNGINAPTPSSEMLLIVGNLDRYSSRTVSLTTTLLTRNGNYIACDQIPGGKNICPY
eukprot:m.20181 g.20181  ORF g.20181 m.20181 type:complete len:193 (-) comp12776_c0_seq1:86-664(-)